MDVFSHPWLGSLFGDEAISAHWAQDAQLGHYRSFEQALALALEATGRVPPGTGRVAAQMISTTDIELSRLAKATARDGLPIPDMVSQLRAGAGEAAIAIHTGATSQDVLDTALALTLRPITDLMVDRLRVLDGCLDELAAKHGFAPLMGRTRMQAALPVTVRDRVDTWRTPLQAHVEGLETLRSRVERLQLGGAVGTRDAFGANGDAIAANMAESLGLANGPAWHTDRTGIAEYASRLSMICGSLGKMGQDIALMAQQGIDEVRLAGGGGSSAMPHKSNPVLAELLVTLARYNAAQVGAMHQALVHEQERSGSAWMLEWMVLPPMTVATGRALAAAIDLIGSIDHLGRSNGS